MTLTRIKVKPMESSGKEDFIRRRDASNKNLSSTSRTRITVKQIPPRVVMVMVMVMLMLMVMVNGSSSDGGSGGTS
ncbi:hypothetical protein M0802_000106 [Mischocyttarus mexicanus]|nr:hypothetical protein M0802_000106 [Mischocyttarus mexicanus]